MREADGVMESREQGRERENKKNGRKWALGEKGREQQTPRDRKRPLAIQETRRET